MSITILHKQYSSEDLADLDRDISECIDPVFNPAAAKLPEPDEYGFQPGTFTVTVEWHAD